jgi:hypothetical protein
MHEDVLATLVGGDETVTFLGAEPLDRSDRHALPTLSPQLPFTDAA